MLSRPETPRPFLSWIAASPCKACGILCGINAFVFFLWIGLIATVGSSFFAFTTTMPATIREQEAQQRVDAVTVGIEDHELNLVIPQYQLRQSIPEGGTPLADLELEFLYISKSGSVFSTDRMRQIQAIEKSIRSKAGMGDFCLRDWSSAAIANAANQTFVQAANAGALPPCKPSESPLMACKPSAGGSCLPASSTPVGLLDCANPNGCDIGTLPINKTFTDIKLQQYATKQGPAWMKFFALTQSNFGPGATQSTAVRSIFRFALPLAGYKNVEDRHTEQVDKVKAFLKDSYLDTLLELKEQNLDVWFQGTGLADAYLQRLIQTDALFAILSILFVLFYIVLMTQSWWLALVGVMQTVTAFAPAYLLYRLVFQQHYFGIFNVLTIYIVIGIAADDVFISVDAWNLTNALMPELPLASRLTAYWNHAAKAMLVTTATTVFSFIATATSSLPAIRTFGLFAASVVAFNYIAVVTLYAAAIAVYHTKFASTPFCCGATQRCARTRGTSKNVDIVEMTASSRPGHDGKASESPGSAPFKEGESGPEVGRIETFFRDSYFPVIQRFRIPIILAFVVICGLFIASATSIQVDPDPPKFLPEGNNFNDFRPAKAKHFARGGSVFSLVQRLVWGIDKGSPISREGVRDTDVDNLGETQYNSAFHMANAARCMLAACERYAPANPNLKIGGVANSYVQHCWIRDMHTRVLATRGSATWSDATGAGANRTLFMSLFNDFLFTGSNYATHSPYIYGRGGSVNDILFTFIEFKLTQESNIAFSEGIDLYNAWEADFSSFLSTNDNCSTTAPGSTGFQYAVQSNMFFQQQSLVRQAISGILLSLGLAAVVLTIFTANWVGSLMASLTIAVIVVCIVGSIPIMGSKLGILESIVLIQTPGLAVDFTAHALESYLHSHHQARAERVRDMLTQVGVSIVSGAVSTIGAALFLFLATINFFDQLGLFILLTIIYSIVWALVFFPALLCVMGPENDAGSLSHVFNRLVCLRKRGGKHVSDADVAQRKATDDDEV